jgi:cytochrome c556
MNIRFVSGAGAILLALALPVFAFQSDADYPALMKAAAGANGKLQKAIQGELSSAESAAADVKSSFKKIEEFWAKKGAEDAQTFAKNIQQAADEAGAAAKAGKQDDATAAAKKIGANCGGCHKVHREKGGEGWIIK